MKTRTLAFAAFFLVSVSLFGQENESKNESKEAITYSGITEFGFYSVSPWGISFEATTVNGFTMDKHNHFGLGVGMGYNIYSPYKHRNTAYMPVFMNYRYCFTPNKKFSPHVNVSLGGVMVEDGGGVYTSLTMGFRIKKFSFSSGLSFMAVRRNELESESFDHSYFDENTGLWVNDPYAYWVEHTERIWYFPFGFTIKCGFAF